MYQQYSIYLTYNANIVQKDNGEVPNTDRTGKQTNPEHEAEERAKQERLNRQFTTYLGQSSNEYTSKYQTQFVGYEIDLPNLENKPWYEGGTSEVSEAKQQRMERRKNDADPLSTMSKYLSVKATSDTLTRPSRQQLAVVRAQLDITRQERAHREKHSADHENTAESERDEHRDNDNDTKRKDKENKDKKDRDKKSRDKKNKDKKHKVKKHKSDKNKDAQQDTLERLRRERIVRENEERAQLQRLVQGSGGQPRGQHQSRGQYQSRDQYQSRGQPTGTRVERGGERMREDY